MTAFVAIVGADVSSPSAVPATCQSALRTPGSGPTTVHSTGGFACAAAKTGAGGESLLVSQGVVLAGDVRLDGRDELVRALRNTSGGSSLRTGRSGARDDLGVVLAAYRAWGRDFVERLRGEFSFVLWDGATRSWVAARDGLGVRPLYFAEFAGTTVVGNAVNAVRAHPSVGSALHPPAIASFLAHGCNYDLARTTFSSVRRVAPGGCLRSRAGFGSPDIGTHWRLPDPEPLRLNGDEAYVDRFRELVGDAVRDRITGPTTILLSGGLDSSCIAAVVPAIAPSVSVSALTFRVAGVEGPDESRLAKSVADQIGLPHETRLAHPSPLSGQRAQTPEPYDDPELAANANVHRSIAERTPVVLNGEDGDALLAPPSLAAMMRAGSPLAVLRGVIAHTTKFGRHPYMGFWLAKRIQFWRPESPPLPDWLRGSQLAPPEPDPPHNLARPEAAQRLAQALWQAVHLGTDREFVDAPIEYRWPLLDTRLIEFAFAIPPMPWCQRKEIMRRALRGRVPDDVVTRPKITVPGYFEAAIAEWQNRTGASCTPLHERTADFVDPSKLAEALRSGETEQVLGGWRALQFDAWIRGMEAA